MSASPETDARFRALIRDVPDYPKPGIVFKDITPLVGDAAAFRMACEAMAAPFSESGITHVAAIESRGFLFGAPIAIALGAAVVPVRKRGKLPWESRAEEYELEYGTDALEMHVDAVPHGSRVLVVDDVLATGGTAAATCRLVERLGGTVAGCTFLMRLAFLPGMERLHDRRVVSLLAYD
ncbi:MAG: adenine phosphoribosyltransferase [Gemmatimonadaceae bacterium]|nr:adenine phosphoribosyltransferase [Gemmatimonadaceae bacterium]